MQSQGRIGQKLAETIYFGNYEEDNDEILLWTYSCLMEDVLPVGFFNHMIEPQVLSALLDKIFRIIDPDSAEILRDIPSLFFMPYFFSLFTEIKNENVRLTFYIVLDLNSYL